MPSVLPRTSWLSLADLSQPPSWAATERGKMRRSSMTISPMTSSATLRVLENGALNTGMPSRLGGIEIDLVGADAEAADRDQPVGGLAAPAAVICVRERMPRTCTPLSASMSACPSSALGRRSRLE